MPAVQSNTMKKIVSYLFFSLLTISSFGQTNWVSVDSLYQPLPTSAKLFKTTSPLNQKPFIAYALIVELKDPSLDFTVDTTFNRRLTPAAFYQKNNKPLAILNTSFFSFTTHQNLNIVVKDGKQLAFQIHSIAGKGKDTMTWRHPIGSALGINRFRMPDVAWVYTDSFAKYPLAIQQPIKPLKDSTALFTKQTFLKNLKSSQQKAKNWKMATAVGGGPVLVQNGKISIANDQEMKFAGKAIDDKHPRSAIGYTADGKLVIVAIEGRHPGVAEGATLKETAQLLIELGCIEALNLDGGGSSCLLINGKQTITPSDKEGERAVPGVFIIQLKN
ncbi:MAG: phosphodiester glycosidase family protein [Chitinophagaceae bacterium]|nr:phosphodiester glycosidase family protein [Chitinophagaceae bacterium]